MRLISFFDRFFFFCKTIFDLINITQVIKEAVSSQKLVARWVDHQILSRPLGPWLCLFLVIYCWKCKTTRQGCWSPANVGQLGSEVWSGPWKQHMWHNSTSLSLVYGSVETRFLSSSKIQNYIQINKIKKYII